MRRFFQFSFFFIFLQLSIAPAQAISKFKADQIIEEGVNKTVFKIADTGRVIFILPSELLEKDKFSGTITYKPFGKTKAVRKSNLSELKNYSVDVRKAEIILPDSATEEERKKIPSPKATKEKTTASGIIPEKTKRIEISLTREGKRKKFDKILIEEESKLSTTPTDSCLIPSIAQGNHPVVVQGNFDGLAENTSVTMDGVKCMVLAESPREMVFKSPIALVGNSKLHIEDNGNSVDTEIVNLKLRLHAKKLKLKMGEKTQLYVKVEGAGDTKIPAELVIKNLTPDIVSIEGGDEQVVQIPAGGHN